ncbi:MAG: hypothetical protein LUD81_08475 [Clostridiales bacterium]|nr:hypothetical protein [Clostridiales bacterium]
MEIKAFLSSGDEGALFSKLKEQAKVIKTEIGHKTMLLAELEGFLENFERNGEIMSYENNYSIDVKMSRQLYILSSRQRMAVSEFGRY